MRSGKWLQAAHEALWARFIGEDNIFLDYVGLDGEFHRPTPEECRLCQPNAMSWGGPNENGSFFGGVYLEGMVNRWLLTGDEADRAKARRIAEGLMFLASVGETRGFVARGVATDGRSHFPVTSNDQTTPWLCGMWRYVMSGAAEEEERERITAKMIEIVELLRERKWRTPCDFGPFDTLNDMTMLTFESSPRLLWLCKVMAALTGDDEWEGAYERLLPERLEVCQRGMVWEHGPHHAWISSNSVATLRGLWELESNPERKAAYAEGLARSAKLAAGLLPLALEFDYDDPRGFSCDWRVANTIWVEQQTVAEAVALARRQWPLLVEASPRWPYESNHVREPLFAAWIISMCPEAEVVERHREAIEAALERVQGERLHLAGFFVGEVAWYQMERAGVS